jgi:Arc/MetJ family transcription regulator
MPGHDEGVGTVKCVARLNVSLPDDLHARAKSAAALSGLRLQDFVESAVREAVERFEAERAKERR